MKSDTIKAIPAKAVRNSRFLHNEKRIIAALCVTIHERRINVRAKELYRQARITAPTFYLHYRNSNDVRMSYESQIVAEIDYRVPARAKADSIFVILISYIVKNQPYFLAVNSSRDHYLLTQLLFKYRANLVGNRLNDRSFLNYVGKIITTITIWLEFDNVNAQTAQRCVKELLKIRA